MLPQRLVETLGYNLLRATLVGNPAPWVKDLHDRMTAPQPGDLVLETSTVHRENGRARLGVLVREAREPVPDWPVDEGEAPLERVWYIQLLDGEEVRWNDASFIALPTDLLGGADIEFVSDAAAAGFGSTA